jgi:hypothetical protein
MLGQELRVEQRIAANLEPRNQVDERHFAGVALARKHALAKKRPAQTDAVETANESLVAPALDRMRATCIV